MIKMVGVNEKRNGRERLVDLLYDIEDFLPGLKEAKEKKWRNSKSIWGELNIKKLTKEMKGWFREFEEYFQLAEFKVEKAEWERIQKFRTKAREVLNDSGKERRI